MIGTYTLLSKQDLSPDISIKHSLQRRGIISSYLTNVSKMY